MGVCEKTTSEIGQKRENQQKILGSEIKQTNIYLNKVSRSLCKITVRNIRGTGFLIKINTNINNAIFFLMTNEHVLTKELIERNEIITFYYDNGFQFRTIKLDKNERIIIEFKNISLDITIVQILQKDNINEDYFLLPSLKYNKIKIGDKIYIPQYPNNLNVSEGTIIDINFYELSYNASTELGASGSPIILDNTIEVIGIHKEGSEYKNYGNFIYPILNQLNKVKNKEEYYIGDIKNGLRQGKGKLYYNNGILKYEGDFINDKFEGYGKYFNENENKWKYYIGEWKNGLKHGKGKIFDKNENLMYEGDFANGELEGKGKFFSGNGVYYVGEFKNGSMNGKGKLVNNNGITLYEGNFSNNKIEGEGKYKINNKEYFEGELKGGLVNGKGKLYYKNGNIKFEGEIYNSKAEGDGIYYKEVGEYYIGQFSNGKIHGKGKWYYKNRKLKYDGFFVVNKLEGFGKFYDENGEYYIGKWKNGLFNGKGTKYDKSGNIKYQGDFINNKYEGNGIIYFGDGKYFYKGEFKNGQLCKGKIYKKNDNGDDIYIREYEE